MCLTYVISTILLAQFPPQVDSTGAHWGFIIMTWLFNFCFATMGSLCMPNLLHFILFFDQFTEVVAKSYIAWMIPAEIFDTTTRARGVALGCMVSFAFKCVFSWPESRYSIETKLITHLPLSTMIGQVTHIGMANSAWKFYILFVVSVHQIAPRSLSCIPGYSGKPSLAADILYLGLQFHQCRLLLGHAPGN
jgi:hypothetical protein